MENFESFEEYSATFSRLMLNYHQAGAIPMTEEIMARPLLAGLPDGKSGTAPASRREVDAWVMAREDASMLGFGGVLAMTLNPKQM